MLWKGKKAEKDYRKYIRRKGSILNRVLKEDFTKKVTFGKKKKKVTFGLVDHVIKPLMGC